MTNGDNNPLNRKVIRTMSVIVHLDLRHQQRAAVLRASKQATTVHDRETLMDVYNLLDHLYDAVDAMLRGESPPTEDPQCSDPLL